MTLFHKNPMNSKRIFFISLFLIFAGLFLSACAGGAVANSWPGVSVDGETIYLANNQNVFSLNVADGSENWRFLPEGQPKNASFYAPPAFDETGQVFVGGYHKIFYAISETGQQTWTFDEAKNSYFGSALYNDGVIYAPNGDGFLRALSSSGELIWSSEAAHGNWAVPVMTEKCLIQASMDHHVYCLDKNNGEVIWESEDLGGAITTAPEMNPNGILYVGTLKSEVVAIDGSTGKVLKRFTASGWVWSSPLLYEGKLIFGDLNGVLYAIDADTFEKIWDEQYETVDKRQILGKPLASNGKIYFGTETGNFFIVDPVDGTELNRKDIGGETGKIYASPVAAGDLILIAPNGTEASLIAVDGEGNQRWSFVPVKK